MKRSLWCLLAFLLCCGVEGWGQVALDGTPVHRNVTSGTSFSLPALTTANAGDIVKVSLTINATTVSSISSPNTTGWALRKAQAAGGGNDIETWVGTATTALSAEVITVNLTGGATFATADAYAISGADTSTKFDSNASLPDAGASDPRTVSTSNANDFIDGCFRMSSQSTPTEGAGWTKISGADFQLCEYKIVSTTQSGLSVTIGTGVGDSNAGIADALIKSSGGGSTPKSVIVGGGIQ